MTKKSSINNWIVKSGWSIADQALFAGANFLVNILLARWLTESDYGSFAFCFSLFLYIGAIHTGFLSEPMLVFGPGKYKKNFASYLSVLRKDHFRLTGLSSILIATASLALGMTGHLGLAWVVLSLALASPLMLFVWLNRRSCYVLFDPKMAAFGGVFYLLCILAGLFALLHFKLLSSVTAFVLIGLSGLVASLFIIRQLRKRESGDDLSAAEVRREHWRYGKWAASTGVLQMTPGQLSLLVLPIWAGIEASGELKALSNLLMPVMHAYVALTVLMVPAFVKALENGNFRKVVFRVTLFILAATILYSIFLLVFGSELISILYKGKYASLERYLPLAAIIPIVSSVVAVLSAAIKASERPDLVFWANLSSAIGMLSLGLVLIYQLKIEGALLAQIASVVFGLVVLIYIYARELPRQTLVNGIGKK